LSLADTTALPAVSLEAGTPVFAEPWQAQAFALVHQLHASGMFSWEEWTNTLAVELQRDGEPDDGSRYYEHWLAAMERLVTAKSLVAPSSLLERKQAWKEAYRRTPHGQPVDLM
jgi:nitrile hydratase accessory protein